MPARPAATLPGAVGAVGAALTTRLPGRPPDGLLLRRLPKRQPGQLRDLLEQRPDLALQLDDPLPQLRGLRLGPLGPRLPAPCLGMPEPDLVTKINVAAHNRARRSPSAPRVQHPKTACRDQGPANHNDHGYGINEYLQRLSHDPIHGARASTVLTKPITIDTGTRIPGPRFGDARVHAVLQSLLVHRLLPHGFANRDLRTLIVPLLGTMYRVHQRREDDLRPAPAARARAHRTHPPHPPLPITDIGLTHALLFSHAHNHLLPTWSAQLTTPTHPCPSRSARR